MSKQSSIPAAMAGTPTTVSAGSARKSHTSGIRSAIADVFLAVTYAAAVLCSVLFTIGHLSWHEFEVLGSIASLIAFGSFAASENAVLEKFVLRYSRVFIAGFFGLVTVALLGCRLLADTERPNLVLGFAMASIFSALSTYYVTRALGALKKSP